MNLDLDGELADLATAIGLTTTSGTVRSEWLADPIGESGAALRDPSRRTALFDLVAAAFGGGPSSTADEGSRWVPLGDPGAGFFLVLTDGGATGPSTLGIGAAVEHSTADIAVTGSVFVPAVELPTGTDTEPRLAIGSAAGAILARVAFTVDDPALALDEVGVALRVPTDGSTPSVDLTLLVDSGAGQTETITASSAATEPLADLQRAFTLLVEAQLASSVAGSEVEHLFALVGLGPAVGGADQLPALPLGDPSALLATLRDWAAGVLADVGHLGRWLSHLKSALVASTPRLAVAGTGSAADPWLVDLPAVDAAIAVTLRNVDDVATVAVSASAAASTALSGRPAAARVILSAPSVSVATDLSSMSLDTTAAGIGVRLGYGDATNPLLPTPPLNPTDPNLDRVGVDSVHAGFDVDGTAAFTPVLLCEGVTVTDETFAVVDLTDTDSVLAQAADLADSVLDDVLAAIGTGAQAASLLALLGAIDPPSAASWPVPRNPAQLLGAPLDAIRGYWSAVLAADRFDVLVDELATVLGVPAATESPAAGRWTLPLAAPDSGPRADLVVLWTDGRLSFEVDAVSVLDLDTGVLPGDGDVLPTLRTSARLSLLALTIGTPARPTTVSPVADIEALGGLAVTLAVLDPGEIRGSGIGITSDAIGLTFEWRRGTGVSTGVDVEGGEILRGGTRMPFPTGLLDPATRGAALGSAAADVVESLVVAALAEAPAASGLADLAALVGWGPHAVANPPPGIRLDLAALRSDPVGELVAWLARNLAAGHGQGFASVVLDWVAAKGRGSVGLPVVGAGSIEHPWSAPVTDRVSVLCDIGTRVVPTTSARGDLLTEDLLAAIEFEDPELATGRDLAALVEQLGSTLVELRRVVGERDIAALTEAVDAAIDDTDGVFDFAAYLDPHAEAVALPGASFLSVPAAIDVDGIAGAGTRATALFASVPLPGLAPWADVDTTGSATVDLRGRAPSSITSSDFAAAGPWAVLVDGAGPAAATEVSDVIAAAALACNGGSDVTVVAHGLAGVAARSLVGSATNISTLVTVAAPTSATTPGAPGSAPATEGALLMRALRGLSGDPASDELLGAVLPCLALQLPDTVAVTSPPTARFDAGVFAGITAPPAPAPRTTLHVRAGHLESGAGTLAMAEAVAGAVEQCPDPAPVEALASWEEPLTVGCGVAISNGPPTPGPDIEVRSRVAVDLLRLAAGVGGVNSSETPLVGFSFEIGRPGGWLVRPTETEVLEPRVRVRAVSVWVGVLTSGEVETRVDLLDASAHGVHRSLWPLLRDAGAGSLTTEERVIVEAVAAELGSATEAPAVAVVDALTRLGVISAGVLSLDTLERAVTAPAQLAPAIAPTATRAALVSALAQICDGTASGAVLDVRSGTAAITVDLGSATPSARVDWGAQLAPGTEGFEATVGADVSHAGTVGSARLALTDPAGSSFALVATRPTVAGPTQVLAVAEVVGRPRRDVPLWPTADQAALEDLACDLLVVWCIRALSQEAVGRFAVARDLFAAAGLVDPATLGMRWPVTAALSPGAWLQHVTTFGLDAVVDGVGAVLTGSTGALPGGLSLAVLPGPELAVTLPVTTGGAGGVRVGGQLRVSPGAPVSVAGAASLEVLDPSGDPVVGASLDLAGPRLELLLAGQRAELYPDQGSFSSLASGGARLLLPLVLDAAAGVTIGGTDPVARIGDALLLRSGQGTSRTFDITALEAFATDPLVHLQGQVAAFAAEAAALVSALVAATSAGTTLTVPLPVSLGTAQVEVDLDAPSVTVTVTDVEVSDHVLVGVAATYDGELTVSAGARLTGDRLEAGAVRFWPEASFAASTAAPLRADVGLWFSDADQRAGLFGVRQGASVSVVSRTVGSGGQVTDDPDLAEAFWGLLGGYVVPIVVDLVVNPLQASLDERPLGAGTPRVRELLAVSGEAGYFALDGTQLRAASGLFGSGDAVSEVFPRAVRTLNSAAQQLNGTTVASVEPFDVVVASSGGLLGLGVTVQDGKSLVLVSSGDLQLTLDVDDSWLTAGTPAGLSLLFLDVGDPAAIGPTARLVVGGVGLRATSPGKEHLFELGVSVGGVGLHSLVEVGGGPSRFGGQVVVDRLSLPMSAGTGSTNPVASSVMGDPEDPNTETVASTFSPRLWIVDGNLGFRAGEGDGPWWLPVQRAFGPIYVEQVGVGSTLSGDRLTHLQFLLDGGASLLGLAVQVDDLEVGIPLETASDLTTWTLDLAALALSYQGGGVSVVAGFGKFDTALGPEYRGLAQARFSSYGATGVGAYGMFDDGQGGSFPSLFVFIVVDAPIGGPPPFFVTAIGGGMGINRALEIPADITEVPSSVFLTALGGSGISDPMGMLEQMGVEFPPDRGALWFAAGLRFTSFALVHTRAVLSVEVNDGLEINLLGLSSLALPSAELPIANIELAMQARFSTVEGLFSVLAQLTDNSWIINQSCRLTGGFAFVVWFKGSNAGQFVLTLGGYHKDFVRPADFPEVPRLGFSWEPNNNVVVKGGAYFALTSSAVMAGGDLEVAYEKGIAWASFTAGAHFLASWDPYYFDARIYVSISAGVEFRACFIVCKTVRLSFDFGVDVHIWGPKLRGTATLDLSVITVTVKFGPSDSTNSQSYLGWSDFKDKYVLAPPDDSGQRHAVALTVTEGQVATGRGTNEETQDGSSTRPIRLEPEFLLVAEATHPFNRLTLTGAGPARESGWALGLGPMGVTTGTSELTVSLTSTNGNLLSRLVVDEVVGKVPDAVWHHTAPTSVKAEAKMRTAWTGLTMGAVSSPAGRPAPIIVVIEGVRELPVRPLPLLTRARWTSELGAWKSKARRIGALLEQHDRREGRVAVAARLLSSGGLSSPEPTHPRAVTKGETRVLTPATYETRREAETALTVSWNAPILTGSLADGIEDRTRRVTKARAVAPVKPTPRGPRGIPQLIATLRPEGGGGTSGGLGRTTSSARGKRTLAPTLAGVEQAQGRRLGAGLTMSAAPIVEAGGTVSAKDLASRPGASDRLVRNGMDARLRAESADAAKRFAGRAGTPTEAGALSVWSLPGSDRTEAADDAITVTGTARVVAFDSAGTTLADAVVSDGAIAVHPRAATLAYLACEKPTATARAGWLARTQVAQVGDHAFVGPGCTVAAVAADRTRRRQRTNLGSVQAGAALGSSTASTTTLPADVRTVVVVASGRKGSVVTGEQLGLEMLAGRLTPVSVHDVADQTVIVAAVRGRGGEPVRVVSNRQRGVALLGLVGTSEDAGLVASAIESRGLEAVDPGGITPSVALRATVRWKGAS